MAARAVARTSGDRMHPQLRRAATLLALAVGCAASVATSQAPNTFVTVPPEPAFLLEDDALSAPLLVPDEGLELSALIAVEASAPAAMEGHFRVEVLPAPRNDAAVELEVIHGTTAADGETLLAAGSLRDGVSVEGAFVPLCDDPTVACAHDEPILIRLRRTTPGETFATLHVVASAFPTERPAGPADSVEVTLHGVDAVPAF